MARVSASVGLGAGIRVRGVVPLGTGPVGFEKRRSRGALNDYTNL